MDNNRDAAHSDAIAAKSVSRRARRLQDVLDAYGAPPVIDYLSLDVEGAEGRALSAGQHMRQIANNVPHAAVELTQLFADEPARQVV